MAAKLVYPPPPPHVIRYIEAIGADLTSELLLKFGGAELALPSHPKGRSEVERVLGPENVQRLSEVSDKLYHRIPLATEWLAQCLAVQGLSIAAIARRLRHSDVTVRKDLRALEGPVETPQRAQRSEQEATMASRGSFKDRFEGPFEEPSNGRFKPEFTVEEHRRDHRPGRPSKIDTDPELRAFVIARIDTTTFVELAKQIAAHFPAGRRVGKSAIHHWWQKQPNRSGR